ncbi:MULTISPECIES: thioesterase II family protein [Streptomycetaceae]|uniref:Thioesterase n=1 Tax=Streptantibioticus cattleyicolor (strain ATCC 35852 / DSM 46488 / JCM 4925 / NBRC 14057 / NRRL 8057) TaxID=1003195 RepID=F8JYD9_STREN|nr:MULTISPECIES: alpha/beta fold hydrolase [Streptomycetaceae]AEW95933.1 thioesterase [Streptantibioticus cattleyicolor NRRL 8057 = DSM 46488]MYS60470.1 alpha/beta fold hydrolase [Streptomyces sp. SID5468]CCB76269.1 Thioesterase [Streptantibioticus cattleyicolor NRRL 8057 = DSM 46488]
MTDHHDDYDVWIRRFHPAPEAAATLVCFPHAGGSASAYFPFSKLLSPGVEVLAVQYPGRQDRRWEPPARSVEELADAVAAVLHTNLTGRFALFGHSMGAAVAFEVARRLEREQGLRPAALFCSARRAPTVRLPAVWERVPGDEDVVAELRKLSGTDAAILDNPDLLRIFLPVIRADYQVAGGYLAGPDATVDCPITVLAGDRDPETSLAEARGWAAHTKGEFDMHVYPGGHFFIEEHRPAMAEVVAGRLLPA